MSTVVFSSASVKDAASRVTFNQPSGLVYEQGKRAIAHFRHKGVDYSVLFYSNRKDASTMKTTSWPQGLPRLKPGKTFECEVTLEPI